MVGFEDVIINNCFRYYLTTGYGPMTQFHQAFHSCVTVISASDLGSLAPVFRGCNK